MKIRNLLIFLFIIGVGYSAYKIGLAKKYNSSLDKLEVLSPFTNNRNIFSFFLKTVTQKPKKIIFGYLPYWSIDKIPFLQLDKLTDIAYFGLYINADGNFKEKLDDGTTEPGYNVWKNDLELKKLIQEAKRQDIRFALTIISHDDEISDKFLECKECWVTLKDNIVRELDFHGIRDVNLNFEYANFEKEEMAGFYTELTNYLNMELDKKFGDSFLTVATFADSMIKPRVTNIEALGKVSDGLFIMGYDFHRPDSDNAGPVAPLDGKGVHAEYDIATTITDYLTVTPPNKIILGVPYYGYNWVVEEDEENAKRIPGEEDIGFSQSQAYTDIMDTIIKYNPEIKWDELGKTPYFTYISEETGSTRQVYFENDKSLKFKYELIKNKNLAGVGIWALGYDGGYQELWNLLYEEFVK